MNKIQITTRSSTPELDDLDGLTLNEISIILGELITKYGENAILDIARDYDDERSSYVVWERLETNYEYDLRMERARQNKIRKEEREKRQQLVKAEADKARLEKDKKEYLRLKKIFEKDMYENADILI